MSPRLRFFASLVALASFGVGASAQVNVLTRHNDIARTGQNLAETTLSAQNVSAARFGKLFERPVDSNIWSQPLVVSGVQVPNKGTRNVVYVQTEVGQIYAFDADNASETAPLWRRDLAPQTFFDSVSTPVIDLGTQTIYCTVRHWIADSDGDPSNDNAWFTFHGLDIRSGVNKFAPVRIEGSVDSVGGKGAVNGRRPFLPQSQKQRPALLNLGNTIYAAFGGSVDAYLATATWSGWIFGFDKNSGAIKSVWATTPDRNGGGIWQAGNGLSSDGTHIFAVTGNGGNNPLSNSSHAGGRDYGNSVVKLTPNAGETALSVSDFFTPYNFQYMEDADQDLGAAGSMLVPGTNLMVTGDKSARLYVLNRSNLGQFTAGQNNVVQDLPAWKGHLHGSPVYYNSPTHGPLIYGWPEHDYLKAFSVLGNQGVNPSPTMRSKIQAPPGMPGGSLSISANGQTANSAVLWANLPLIGDANSQIVPGILRAYDANDLTKELWNSELVPQRDKSGFYGKFSPPTVANGKVYLSTFYNPQNYTGAKLVVYGLLPSAPIAPAPANLTAAAGLQKVSLSWAAEPGATTYTLKRSTNLGGPYTTLAQNLRTTTYEDFAVQNGTLYFYVVCSENAGGQSPNSNEASARPFAPAPGQVISVNFGGGTNDFGGGSGLTTPMGATETAGVVPAPNWTTLSAASGSQTLLRGNGGAQTSAQINWNCAGNYATTLPDAPGNARMMKGYLSNSNTTDTTVSVSNLPANFLQNGYDVYVYSDGFTIGSTTKKLTDSQNRDFEGDFVLPGIADVGNYVVFPNLNSASFTLTAARSDSTDNLPRAPVNGLQIVARAGATGLAAPTNLSATPVNGGAWLNWNAVSGAASYRVLRATQSGGPYVVAAANLSVPRWNDPSLNNDTTYFYVVNAISSLGEISPPSNEASVRPTSSNVGRVVSIDFGGGSTGAMGASEVAGAAGVAKANWNSAFYASGGLGDLKDDLGATTTLDAVWSNGLVGDLSITNTAGQNRMMRGYTGAAIGQTFEVALYNIPSNFTANGFDIYVYSDNNNGGARTTKITSTSTLRGTAIINITDAANANFNGSFTNGNYANGNLAKVMNISDANVILRFENFNTTDGWSGGAVNGIQLVARTGGSSGGSS